MIKTAHLNVTAIMRNEAAGVSLDAECYEMNGTEIHAHVGLLKDVRPDVEILRYPGILILDVNPRDPDEIQHLDAIVNRRFPDVPVIGTAADATVQDVRQFMRLGVVDFIPQPFTRADILAAINLAAARREMASAPAAAKGRVISLLKGGGGMGATTLAVQGGCLLAAGGKEEGRNVGLFDLDLQSGTAALYLDLNNRVGMGDLIDAAERLDNSLLEAVLQVHGSGLRVAGAPQEVIPLDSMTPEFVNALIDLVRDELDVILLDLPPVWTEGTYAALHRSDAILLVTQLSVAGVRQARHQLDTLRHQGLAESQVLIVVNRHERGWGRSVQIKEAEKALGRAVDYTVPNDFKLMSEALNQGVALATLKTRSKVGKSIRAMMLDTLVKADERAEATQSIAALPSTA